MRHIAIVKRAGSDRAWDLIQDARKAYPQLQWRLIADEPPEVCPFSDLSMVSASTSLDDVDLILSLGGDGTIIRAAGLVQHHVVPILAVNLGRLGFLAEITSTEWMTLLPQALDGRLPYEDRTRLWAKVHSGDRVVLERSVLNDVVVASGNLARITTYRMHWDDKHLTDIRGDGVVISTPTGSTAYSMAAGGPIVHPGLDACVITPICPHHLTHRPVVLPTRGTLQVSCVQGEQAFVTLDGQVGYGLSDGDRVTVTQASVPARILQHPESDHFRTLRQKLLWGQG